MTEWYVMANEIASRLYSATPSEQFRILASLLLGAKYGWGKENLEETDCSGTVCFPLFMMGYDIRMDANSLLKLLFIDEVEGESEETDHGAILSVFYTTNVPAFHGGKMVPAGTAVHVTPVVGRYVVLNAGPQVELHTARHIRLFYEARDCQAIWRRASFENLKKLSATGLYAWGVDPVLEGMRMRRDK